MNSPLHCCYRRGFTLIEVLTVVGICAVIAAIVVPVFLSVRENGRRTTCLSNERQIGIATLQYVEDNNNFFPAIGEVGLSDWVSLVYPYLKTTSVFACPDDPTPGPFQDSHEFVDSYGMNSDVMGGAVGLKIGLPYKPTSQVMLTSPAHTVMLFEVTNDADALHGTTDPPSSYLEMGSATGNTNFFCGSYACGIGVQGINTPAHQNYPAPLYVTGNIGGRILNGGYPENPRHNNGADFVACDGHVEWLLGKDVSGGRTAPAQDCDQGTASMQPVDCKESGRKKSWYAAGTLCSNYKLTFSPM